MCVHMYMTYVMYVHIHVMCSTCVPEDRPLAFNLFHFLSTLTTTIVQSSGGVESFFGLFQFPLFRRWPTKQQTGGRVVVGIDQVDLAASSLGVLVRLPRGVGRCLDGIERPVAFVHIHWVRQRGVGIFHTGVGTGVGLIFNKNIFKKKFE